MTSSLYPKSSVNQLVQKAQSQNKKEILHVEAGLAALLRNQVYRADLFSIFASLCGASQLNIKLKSYQLAINNRRDDEIIILTNQAMKDLSHSCWNISLISLQYLFYTNDQELINSNVLHLFKNLPTRRAALNALTHIKDDAWILYREKINKILKENVDLTSKVRQAELEISTGNAINDFAFVQEIKPDYPLIILDAIKILNGKECEPLLNTKLSASIYFELISLNPKLFIHSEFKTQIANLKFENKIKQRAGLESIRKMIDMELIQIDIDDANKLIKMEDSGLTSSLLASFRSKLDLTFIFDLLSIRLMSQSEVDKPDKILLFLLLYLSPSDLKTDIMSFLVESQDGALLQVIDIYKKLIHESKSGTNDSSLIKIEDNSELIDDELIKSVLNCM